MRKNILFVCRYNRFRSKVAEAYFKKINKNFNVRSAGAIRGNPIDSTQKKVSKEFGINISGTPQSLSSKLLKWVDVVVVVADDVPLDLFKLNKQYGKKTIVLKIPDTKSNKKSDIQKVVKSVIKKIDKLNKKLENTK